MPQPNAEMQDAGVDVWRAGVVDHVAFRRPPVNALTAGAYARLRAVFEAPTTAKVRVLQGSGRIFCSGQDLREAAELRREEVGAYLTAAGAAVAAVARSPLPLVAVVNGPAVGAGALLVALADVVVMSDRAWVAFPEARLGLPVGLSVLSRMVPLRLARQLLATGDRIPAARLLGMGAVDYVVPDTRLEAVADEIVGRLSALSRPASASIYDTPERAARARDYLDELAAAVANGAWPGRASD